MKSFAFDLGNSSTGAIGAVIRVIALDKTKAVEKVNRFLESSSTEFPIDIDYPDVEYFNVYLNYKLKLTEEDISDEEEI